ncbi:Calcium channel yvc1 [Paecilomyces lecythidis]
MVHWRGILNGGTEGTPHHIRDESRRLLPAYINDEIPPALPSKEVTKVALRLKHQIEQVIPCELDEDLITKPNSRVITKDVIQTAREAGGDEYRACVVYCLLVCLRWFKMQGSAELWDSELYECRAVACEVIAKQIIESEQDQAYLLLNVLLKRYSIVRGEEETAPANVVERAVDLHALRVIGSSGYQKCIKYLWHGWIWQDENDPTNFVEYEKRNNTNYWAHLDPDRMRAPIYQNACQIFFSLLYLALYTGVINTVNPSGDLDVVECILYTMTLAFICDEVAKFWKIGRYYFGFWNAFNSTLYALLAVSFFLRVVALSHSASDTDETRRKFNELSYNFLAFSAPMFWMRLMLYLDTFRFFGAMMVVLKVMMKESLIFFALLFFVLIGFLQAFMGMDQADLGVPVTKLIIQGMANSIMQSPEFETFEDFAFPFGIILYYLFNFVVMVLLLNILIALYNSAYEDVSGNAIDEYLGLFSQKTMGFVRAPDENVFIPPFNLVEIIFLIVPFEWWLPRETYQRLNNYVMATLYAPLLVLIAFAEKREAHRICANRRRGEEDDDVSQEWEEAARAVDYDNDEWERQVSLTTPNVAVDTSVLEIRDLKNQVAMLTEQIKLLTEKGNTTSSNRDLGGQNDDETN